MQFTSAVVLICAAASVQAHRFLRSPTARGGNSAGPSGVICGRGSTSTGSFRATYVQSQTIEVEWEITIAHNNGFVEMRICDSQQVSNACLNENLLRHADNGQTRVNNVNGRQRFSVEYRLPADLTCPNGCVMQWFWDTPNNGE
ncbi:hypothetical protein SARC_06085 [Sphaeroforma arctica JP610]|uniref:Chitin-binding type-4 domain-containing protein n=1 Tax=Sphaeroforma arctica JP610 TaxID=667725 RepID=A0A0L0FXR9_9EUKA|nr:hypothetical protein SARC_06085 [Sphaeroforma arctica JP610]KNC81607.1 hypothetical protein SARC_06085 [Sphaeroforma arctica JP610]|eukprot:XP_014155509.1 hypothetical protein SARC_06085 [Sphaeroforma arctica JP610]